MPDSNVEYYNNHAVEFYNNTVNADMSYWIERFENMLPEGARVLDAGCGSGRDSLRFIKDGYRVTAMDASTELCKMASELIGQQVLNIRFEDMDFEEGFDGVWACASLLHVEAQSLFSVLQSIHKSLKPNGVCYASFKYGEGNTVRGDRVFTDMNETSVTQIFEKAGFDVVACEISGDVRVGRNEEKWINILGVK